jgi:long-chain acyl-CoA synthetase
MVFGNNVMKGYYRNEAATEEAIVQGGLRTGDLGYVDGEGFLVLVGRKRALMIAEDGEKFSPEIVEEAIAASTDVFAQVVVSCIYRKHPCALVTLDIQALRAKFDSKAGHNPREACSFLIREFHKFQTSPAGARIPSQWRPTTFQILPDNFSESDGTLNSTFKIVRHVVEKLHSDTIDYSYTKEGAAPLNQRNLALLEDLLTRSR